MQITAIEFFVQKHEFLLLSKPEMIILIRYIKSPVCPDMVEIYHKLYEIRYVRNGKISDPWSVLHGTVRTRTELILSLCNDDVSTAEVNKVSNKVLM